MAAEHALNTVSVAQTTEQRYEEFLQSRGKRMTKPKRFLLTHVFSRHEHFDAETLLDNLPTTTPLGRIGRATVYRTLKEFVEAGLLREFKLEGRSVYEHDYGYPQHDHLYCQKCQQLFEFQSDELLELRDRVAAEYGFRVESHRLIISGVCANCRQSVRRVRRKVDRI